MMANWSISFLITLLSILTGSETLVTSGGKAEKQECPSRKSGVASILGVERYVEVELGEPLTLSCRVCNHRLATTQPPVLWQREGQPVHQSQELMSYMRSQGEYVLRVRGLASKHLGNYTCLLQHEGGKEVEGRQERQEFHVSLLPPPPVWQEGGEEEQGAGWSSKTFQVLRWRGSSLRPIINYQLEVRLRPEAGSGEDWVTIIVPYESPVQSYRLEGLQPGTQYQARLRLRTSVGSSGYSATLLLPRSSSSSTTSSSSLASPPPPGYSLPREDRKLTAFFSVSATPLSCPAFLLLCACLPFAFSLAVRAN